MMSELNDIQYWHTFIDGGTAGCAAVLAGGIRCHARRDQHEQAEFPEPELPEGMPRDIEWEATHD